MAIGVVDADQSHFRRGDEPLLDRCVIFDCPVTIDMVRRDVDQHADRRRQRGREIDLERRAFDDVNALVRRRLEVENRHADVAAELNVAAGLAQDMRDQRRGRRFAVRAGDGDEGRSPGARFAFAAEQFDVADDLDSGGLRRLHRPMRLGMGQRHAGRENERIEAAPIRRREILERDALRDAP